MFYWLQTPVVNLLAVVNIIHYTWPFIMRDSVSLAEAPTEGGFAVRKLFTPIYLGRSSFYVSTGDVRTRRT